MKAKTISKKTPISATDIRFVQLLGDDYKVSDISDMIGMEKKKAIIYIANLKGRLGVRSAHGLVAEFYRNGLIK